MSKLTLYYFLFFALLSCQKKEIKVPDTINEPYKECGNCEDEQTTDISISLIYQRNEQWSNHCEKGADKDNIMFYSPEEIGFNVTSINFICGATSKQINDKTIEIYLKDSGTDYAPNGEVYSNNNVPKGLNFDDISQDKPVAQVKIINKDSVELTWLGFYNKKTSRREYTTNPFDKNKNRAVLSKCAE